jgi:hypothetical protein
MGAVTPQGVPRSLECTKTVLLPASLKLWNYGKILRDGGAPEVSQRKQSSGSSGELRPRLTPLHPPPTKPKGRVLMGRELIGGPCAVLPWTAKAVLQRVSAEGGP